MKIVYVDNAATTRLSDTALKKMSPYFQEFYGNPSSTHFMGHKAKTVVEQSRKTIAKCIGARNNEIFFTSGGTEADNWAIKSALDMKSKKGNHIITSAIEHSAIYRTAENLEKQGYRITYLKPDKYGHITPEQLEEAICEETILVSIMMAHNEIGTILNIKQLCEVTKKRRILFHTDAVQAVGHIPIDVQDLGVDMLSISAHKFGGPKGVGALFIKTGNSLPPMVFGGGQEKNKRSGTENVPSIVGMAAALEEAVLNIDENTKKITILRDRLIEGILRIPGAILTGDPVNRLPGTASFIFEGLESTSIIKKLSDIGICASSGSACSSGDTELSRVLSETEGITGSSIYGALRISLNENNTEEEIEYIIEELPEIIKELRVSKAPVFI